MNGTTNSTEIAVVSSGQIAGAWQRQLKDELARTRNLSESPKRADALVVIIDKSFPSFMQRAVRHHDDCFEAIREALAAGKMLLPVTVGNARVPDRNSLPKAIRTIAGFQTLVLVQESDLPGAAARLVFAAKTMPRPYVPAKTEDRRVFISYRREDSWYWASLLAKALTQRLAAYNVFFDIGSIAPGRRFDAEIQSWIHSATDFVIVVGPAFLAQDQKGRCRLDDPGDFVRREIIAAIEEHKHIHVVLAGDAPFPAQKQLPSSIAPAFKGVVPQNLRDYRAADSVAGVILGTEPRPILLRYANSVPLRPMADPRQQYERFIATAGPPLAKHGWKPVDPSKTRGLLVMMRPDAEGFRFVFDFESLGLVLEERARSLNGLGLKRWIKRAFFPVSPDAPDIDVLRPPDRQVEAMENPRAYLDRVGRGDLDMDPKPPMRRAQVDRLLHLDSQPAQRALDEQARERARIRGRGGLRMLKCIHGLSLGEDVIARAVTFDFSTGQFVAASSNGAYVIDIQNRTPTAKRIGLRGNLKHLSFSKRGKLAATDDKHRLSVLDSDGNEIVRGRSPYSAWQRLTTARWPFRTLSWSADERHIAIGAEDRVWIYKLDTDEFQRMALHQDDRDSWAAAHFVPGSDDLLIIHFWKLWRVSGRTGNIRSQLDIAAGSDFYDALSTLMGKPAGVSPKCLALSPDGKSLAIGGNDAQMVFVDAETLQPTAMRVWHAPLVDGRLNGHIKALAFSPDGRRLASIGNDGRLVVGDARSGDSLAEGFLPPGTTRYIFSDELDICCWSADGALIAIVTSEGRMEIWETKVPSENE